MARKQRAKEGEIASLATEALSAMQVIKAFGTERFEHDRVQRRSAERLKVGVESFRVEARFGALVDVLGAVATALVLGLGVLSVADGRITPGDLVVVVAYTNKLYKPLKDIAKQASRAARALARLERIAEILSSDMVLVDGTDGSTPDHRAAGAIDLDDVHFRYTAERAALEGVTLHVPSGSRLALVGESGAGKSTVGALVARFYDPSAGSVRVDGRDAREWSLRWVRDQVGVLLQDTILFSGSVRDNIAYGTDADLATDRGGRPGRRGPLVHPGPARRLRHPARSRRRGPLRRSAAAHRDRAGPAARSPGAGAGRADHRSGRRERGAGDGRAEPADRGTHDHPDHPLHRAGPQRRPRRGHGRRAGRRVRHPAAAAHPGLGLPPADRHPGTTRRHRLGPARVPRGAGPRRQEGWSAHDERISTAGGRHRGRRLHRLPSLRAPGRGRVAGDRHRLLHRLLPPRRQAGEPGGPGARNRPSTWSSGTWSATAGRRRCRVRAPCSTWPPRPACGTASAHSFAQYAEQQPGRHPARVRGGGVGGSRRGSCGPRRRRSTATRRPTPAGRARRPRCRARRTASRSAPARTWRASTAPTAWPSPACATSPSTARASVPTWPCAGSVTPSSRARRSRSSATAPSRGTSRS